MDEDFRDRLKVIDGGRRRYRVPDTPKGYTIYIDDDSEHLKKIIRMQRGICIVLLAGVLFMVVAFETMYKNQDKKISDLQEKYEILEESINGSCE